MLAFVNWQIVSFIVVAIINLVTLVGAYYGLKADNAALAAELRVSLVSERAARSLENLNLKTLLLEMLKSVEQNVREVGQRVGTLEAGQDEWTKTLRDRTHELSKQVNELVIKVDRLERPKGA
jgi:uncharacterized protein YicC (UPF0701 family)